MNSGVREEETTSSESNSRRSSGWDGVSTSADRIFVSNSQNSILSENGKCQNFFPDEKRGMRERDLN